MLRSKIFTIALALLVLSSQGVWAKATSVQEIQDMSAVNTQKNDSDKIINKDHWVYKTLEDITKKYGLLMGRPNDKFNDTGNLSRREAAFILVNLVGKIQQDNLQLNEAEKAQLNILKQELHGEIEQLTSRVAAVETSVDSLKGNVSKLEESDKKTWKLDYGENFKINGGLQAQYTGAISKKADDNYPTNFSLPYSEINFNGKIHNHVNYAAQLVPSRAFSDTGVLGSNGILREVYASTDLIPHHTVYLGQTMVPIGYEGPMNPLSIETVDKSQISRYFTDMADLGVKTQGDWDYISYSLGAYNGNGQNRTDSNRDLALSSWAVVKPFAKHPELGKLELGGGYYTGNKNDISSINNLNFYRHIASFYTGYKYKKYAIWGEYATARAKGANDFGSYAASARSFYIHNSYYITPKLQALFRFDQFDPSTKARGDFIREYTLGTNYILTDNLLLMLSLVEATNQAAKNSQRVEIMTQCTF